MGAAKKTAITAAALTVVAGGVLVGLGQSASSNASDFPEFNKNPGLSVNDLKADDGKKDAKAEEAKKADVPGKIDVKSDKKVKNLTDNRDDLIADYCRNSTLTAGEGKANKGGTCVSYPIGEVAKNPVRVTIMDAPSVVGVGKDFTISIKIADRFGPLDLNAFTHDENNKAGDTFLEHPGELDKDGRPLVHAHLGITSLDDQGLPGENYDAAFKGLEGLGDNITAKISGLPPGSYRADVYASEPGHLQLPTALATQVQAFDTVRFKVN